MTTTSSHTSNKGVYIHIPFCVRKCNYCAFLSYPADKSVHEKYVEALNNEIKKCKVDFTSADTIYIGGGTPSILDPAYIQELLCNSRPSSELAFKEITLEANPGTLGSNDDEILARLKQYRNMGINRLSMGVQSMNDDRLKFLGRIHTADEVRRDVRLAREAGFDNINLDLILSVPSDDPMRDAMDDVAAIVELNPEHISCYSLQLEEGTKFFEMYERGELKEIPDELDREIYHAVCDYLTSHGYEHYEISNFALPGKRSHHNSKYWDMSEYVGLGLGASGFEGGVRYTNTDNMEEYLSGKYRAEEHVNTEHDNISEMVFLGLRRKEGVRYADVFAGNDDPEKAFWQYYADSLQEAKNFESSGHLLINKEGIRLTEKGIDISNKIMALFV